MGHPKLITASLFALALLMQSTPVGGDDGMGNTDSVKYLTTFGAFIDPLYVIPSGTSSNPFTSSLDTLPALVNIKLLHTKARYYNTTDHMTNFFANITNHKITNCKFPGPELLDIFQTIYQLTSLSQHQPNGMAPLVWSFGSILDECPIKRHFFLDFHTSLFDRDYELNDRDYVELDVRISDLDNNLRQFINQSFESIVSIESSLKLQNMVQSILQRELLTDIVAFLTHVGVTLILLVLLHATGLLRAGCQMGGRYIYSDETFSRTKYAKRLADHAAAHYLLRVRGGPSDEQRVGDRPAPVVLGVAEPPPEAPEVEVAVLEWAPPEPATQELESPAEETGTVNPAVDEEATRGPNGARQDYLSWPLPSLKDWWHPGAVALLLLYVVLASCDTMAPIRFKDMGCETYLEALRTEGCRPWALFSLAALLPLGLTLGIILTWCACMTHGAYAPNFWAPIMGSLMGVLNMISTVATSSAMLGSVLWCLSLAAVLAIRQGPHRRFGVLMVLVATVIQIPANFAARYLPHVMAIAPRAAASLIFPMSAACYKFVAPTLTQSVFKHFAGKIPSETFACVGMVVLATGDTFAAIGLFFSVLQAETGLLGLSDALVSIMTSTVFKMFGRIVDEPDRALTTLLRVIPVGAPYPAYKDLVLRYRFMATYTPVALVPFLGAVAGLTMRRDSVSWGWAIWAVLLINVATDLVIDALIFLCQLGRHQHRAAREGAAGLRWSDVRNALAKPGGHLPMGTYSGQVPLPRCGILNFLRKDGTFSAHPEADAAVGALGMGPMVLTGAMTSLFGACSVMVTSMQVIFI